ncbi:aldose-1-epimerase [Schaalia sp. 19OD2882]|uniref:aldose-1-epimerase n=1 Tax=Schaalia sp. 19OD2882 TaxID=2794089 RepID=UPI001C1F1390|nr:aldose-1-epimerase [Schaalia sp. 19OD2882]QWW20345.1 aldose-1-epimerase [Schaalia sp. 19OD2882]
MPPAASGKELVLTSGDYVARVVTVGAGIAGLTLRGVDLLQPHAVTEIPEGYLGKTLVPWPNRIANGSYTWQGIRHDVPVNEGETGCALHGLMCWVDWEVVHADKDSATLGTFIAPRPGYPWALQCWVTYALCAEKGLSVTVATKNIGVEAAPYGASSHPYLTVGLTEVDEYSMTIPAATVAEVDEDLIPVALRPAGDLDLDLREGRVLGTARIDHAFTDLPEGPWTVRLTIPATGSWVEIESDARWVQVYTGERLGRRGVAVEPMTCAPNAFNSGDGLVELEPGVTHSLTFTVRGHVA